MPRPRLTATETRPTTRTIAALVGVSSATVSLALRNHPRISVQMRETVERAAIQLGYRPDPQVAKLMHHLRKRQRPGFQSTICAITTITEEKELPYLRDILINARKRADSLGHGFMLMRLEDDQEQRPDLHRVLRSRGVEGVLLAPMLKPRS